MRARLLLAFSFLPACAGAARAPASPAAAMGTTASTATVAPSATTTVAATTSPGALPSSAPPLTPEQVLERLATTERPSAEWFAPEFLKAVPLSNFEAVATQVRAVSGAFKDVRAEDGHWLLEFERASWRADLTLDAQGRVAGLLVKPLEVKTATLEEALADFRNLPGKVSVLVSGDGADLGAIEPDLPLAVGSTFKLAALTALRRDIDKKKRSWTDLVTLRHEFKSLPSGILQEWPDGAPLTLYALAALMISRSDNTATDAIIGLLGRDAIEPFASRNKPYLTTREAFVLKTPANADLLARFEHGDEPTRRATLKETQGRSLPDAEAYPKDPTALDVEWFFTPRELCDLMKGVHDLPLMSISPGVADRKDWDAVAFKGGSEPGVLNMTTWVERGGHAACVSATWNAPQKLEDVRFTSAYRRVLTWLKSR
jgi:beta-lactamase class A